VKHFATKVNYHVGNFIDKNDDTIPKDLQDFIDCSTEDLIQIIYKQDSNQNNTTRPMKKKKKCEWKIYFSNE